MVRSRSVPQRGDETGALKGQLKNKALRRHRGHRALRQMRASTSNAPTFRGWRGGEVGRSMLFTVGLRRAQPSFVPLGGTLEDRLVHALPLDSVEAGFGDHCVCGTGRRPYISRVG